MNYLARVAALGCCICGQPAQVHHVRGGSVTGIASMGRKSPDALSIPLCHNHHQGRSGIHTLGVRTFEATFGDQADMVAATQKKLGAEFVPSSKVLPRR